MNGLNPIEEECREVLSVILDLMAAGHQKLLPKAHMELMGRVRDCLTHLTNREFGCASGKHAGPCQCPKESA